VEGIVSTISVAAEDRSGELGIGRALRGLALTWGGASLLALIAGFVIATPIGILLFLVASGVVCYWLVQLVFAKARVLHEREVPLWKGQAKLVAWNPNEGVVFLKNKQIDFVDDNPHDGGGIRVVYPLLGEELVLRVPLEIRALPFEDTGVLTKEYMRLTVKGTMYWKVC